MAAIRRIWRPCWRRSGAKAPYQLDSAHKSVDAWVRIASSVQAWILLHWEDSRRPQPIRISAHLIPINAPPAEDCTLEAMRTQGCVA